MTKIEWTDQTWNPITGCTPVSPGCAHCYARRMAKRLAGRCGYPAAPHEFEVTLHPERLNEPLGWKKPRRVFVCSMGDLFHEDVPDEYVDAVFAVMAVAEQHTFQVLTKRPERMYRWSQSLYTRSLRYPAPGKRSVSYTYGQIGEMLRAGALEYGVRLGPINRSFPLPNVWLGVTAENQEQANQRIPLLLATSAAVRFVSVEPMLGAINLTRIEIMNAQYPLLNALTGMRRRVVFRTNTHEVCICDEDNYPNSPRLDWVICGGETGPNARPMDGALALSLLEQCQGAGMPFFYKGAGTACYRKDDPHYRRLNGELWEQYPEEQ